jgi:protein farnesyltransferase/geranylgeranyltransferase type-1 subunit alpha
MADFVPHSERAELADLTPIPQDDGPAPVVPIAYSPQFRSTMDYFRAVVKADERSARALVLTQEVVEMNAANYSAWHFRRLCLFAIDANLAEELKYVADMAGENPKNYQIWYHRRLLVEKRGDAGMELEYCAMVFEEDSKNYHAWSHRQWVINHFELWDGELAFIEKMLSSDIRNNSAWNQRFWVVSHTKELTVEVCAEEIAYAMDKIKLAVNNESPWSFILGHVRKHSFEAFPKLKADCLELKAGIGADCVHALSTLVKIYREEDTPQSLREAIQLVDRLATEIDIVRKKYWLHQLATFPSVAQSKPASEESIVGGTSGSVLGQRPPIPPASA